MKFFLIMLTSFLLGSCNRKICTSEIKSNVKLFQKQLHVIAGYEESRKSVLVDDYREALFFLSFVSGINAKAAYSSTIGYSSKEEYQMDKFQWKQWLKENKYILTDHYIDSTYKHVGLI